MGGILEHLGFGAAFGAEEESALPAVVTAPEETKFSLAPVAGRALAVRLPTLKSRRKSLHPCSQHPCVRCGLLCSEHIGVLEEGHAPGPRFVQHHIVKPLRLAAHVGDGAKREFAPQGSGKVTGLAPC